MNQLTENDAIHINKNEFISEEQFRIWEKELSDMGPANQKGLRATASVENESYIDQLKVQLAAAGLTVHSEDVPVERWIADSWSLSIMDTTGEKEIKTAAYIPFSGSTGKDGICAPLSLMKTGKENLKGKIAVTEVSYMGIPEGIFSLLKFKELVCDPQNEFYKWKPWVRSTMGGAPKIKKAILNAEKAGAKGLIIVLDVPYEGAKGNYVNALDRVIRDIPGIYLDRDNGKAVLEAAKKNLRAKLVLKAKREKAVSRNIYAVVEGKRKDDYIILNSHTDGLNAVEENGAMGVSAIAQYIARLPEKCFEKSIMFLFTTGHFLAGIGGLEFSKKHTDDFMKQCSGLIAIEHIGAMEWCEDKNGKMRLTGRNEPALLFIPDDEKFKKAAKNMMNIANIHPFMAVRPIPVNKLGVLKKKLPELPGNCDAMYPGEAQLFSGHGIKAVNYISGPTYTGNWGINAHEFIDYAALRNTIMGLGQMTMDLANEQ